MATEPGRMDQCSGCGLACPRAGTSHTLIGSGWRLRRGNPDRSGKAALEWLCPSCWSKVKEEPKAHD